MISFFLGSGASAPFGYPTTEQFKTELSSDLDNRFVSQGNLTEEEKILFTVLKQKNYKDIEYVFDFWGKLTKLKNDPEYSGLVEFMTSNIFHVEFEGIYKTKHTQAANLKLYFDHNENLSDFLKGKLYENYSWKMENFEKSETIYTSLFNLAKSQSKIDIFTTNYDTVVEEYCKEKNDQYRIIDGFEYDAISEFSRWSPTVFDNILDSKLQRICLYKLHGSLNWKRHRKYDVVKLIDVELPIKNGSQYTEEVLIKPTLFPKEGHNKEPFKTLISKFTDEMKKTDICIVIGYSFRDGNINDVFYEFLKDRKKLIIISDNATVDFNNNFINNYDMQELNTYVLLDDKVTIDKNEMKILYEKVTSNLV